MMAYKLFRVRSNGTIGSLFINKSQIIPVGRQMLALPHKTDGFKYRVGWHCCPWPHMPHLSNRGRKWFVVEIFGVTLLKRSKKQGRKWYIAQRMTVLHPVIRNKERIGNMGVPF